MPARASCHRHLHDSVIANLRAEFAIHIAQIQQRLKSCDRGWATMYSAYLKQGD